MQFPQYAGSFAPPITQVELDKYTEIAKDKVTEYPAISEEMLKLIEMVAVFNQTPSSTLEGKLHPCGTGKIVPLEEKEIQRIWNYVPWNHENKMLQELFDTIPVEQKEFRDAAHHLLWYAVELELDREPITINKE